MNWDKYFYNLCGAVAMKSPCLSRNIGALIVKHNRLVATGYNGPPSGIAHCGPERLEKDEELAEAIEMKNVWERHEQRMIEHKCPRHLLGYKSGEGLHLCMAAHAEENAITNAARLGIVTDGASLYLNDIIPCKACVGRIINAGIVEIVCSKLTYYDYYSKWLLNQTDINVREFEI